jgi:hypothetical protein
MYVITMQKAVMLKDYENLLKIEWKHKKTYIHSKQLTISTNNMYFKLL